VRKVYMERLSQGHWSNAYKESRVIWRFHRRNLDFECTKIVQNF
jgi:hypothetical protein